MKRVLAYRIGRYALIVALGLIPAVTVFAITRFARQRELPGLLHVQSSGALPLRQTPRIVTPRSNWADLIPEEDLVSLLSKLEPFWEYRRASDILHALRLWGPGARFPHRPAFAAPPGVKAPGTDELMGFFLDENSYRKSYDDLPPYFFRSAYGVGIRGGDDSGTTVHEDDFLHLAAELGLRLNTRFHWGDRDFTLADLFAHSFKRFDPQQELEFTAIAYAHYLLPGAKWSNRFGRTYTIDDLAERLSANDLANGSCYATHVPYSIAILLAVDEQETLLSERARGKLKERLRSFSRALEESQGAAGWWGRNWIRERGAAATEPEEVEWVRATGHHLEWIALVRPELRPRDAVVKRAISFLLPLTRISTREQTLAYHYTVSSHAARALVLLAGRRWATELMTEAWAARNRNP